MSGKEDFIAITAVSRMCIWAEWALTNRGILRGVDVEDLPYLDYAKTHGWIDQIDLSGDSKITDYGFRVAAEYLRGDFKVPSKYGL